MLFYAGQYVAFVWLFISIVGTMITYVTQSGDLSKSNWVTSMSITIGVLVFYTIRTEWARYRTMVKSPFPELPYRSFVPKTVSVMYVAFSTATVVMAMNSLSGIALAMATIALVFGLASMIPSLLSLRGGAGLDESEMRGPDSYEECSKRW